MLTSHQPLDGLHQYTAAESADSRHTATASTAGRPARDERKEKSAWDDEHALRSIDDEMDAAAEAQGSVTGTEQASAAEVDAGSGRTPSDSAQHAAHRERDLFHSSWSSVRGSSAVLSVWDECFAFSFNSRCQELVQASFKRFRFHETIERSLEQWKDSAESEAGAAVEPSNAGWSAAAVSSMWSGYRQSAVTALVTSFALQLERLAADIRHLLNCSLADTVRQATAQQAVGASVSAATSSSSVSGQLAVLYPFDYLSFLNLPRFLDDELSPSIHRLYTASVHSMAEQLKRRLAALDHSVLTLMASESSWRSNECRALVERAVFIGRCCASITQQTAFASFSQALQHQHSAAQHQSAATFTLPSFSSSSAPSSMPSSSSPIVAALSSTARSAFRIWSRFVAATVSDEMETSFAAWRRTMTDAQRQRSSAVDSNALVAPVQPSAYIHRVLWSVQQHTYSTHGYQTPNEVLRWMMQDTAIAVTAVIQAQMDAHNHNSGSHDEQQQQQQQQAQPRAAPFAAAPLSVLLQLYFDLLFLLSMMRLPSDAAGPPRTATHSSHQPSSGLAVLQSVEDALAARVSLAGWPALRTSVVSSCIAALQRTQLLFGLLAKRNPLTPLQMDGALDGSPVTMTPATAHNNTSTSAAPPMSASGTAGASTAASGLPLAGTSSRLMTFSTSFYTHSSGSKQQQSQQPRQPVPPHLQHPQQSVAASSHSSPSRLSRSAVSSVPVAAPSSGASHSSSVAANAASVASESAALLKEKGRQLLGKWNFLSDSAV